MSGDEPTPAHLNPDTDGPEWSNITINGERQTWQALYEAEKERRQKSDEWRTLVNDLDRCEHGRHQADVCSSCGGPSRGNPLLPTGTVIGTTLHAGQRIVVPERTERNRIEAWFAAATPAPVTPPTADERGPWCCYADEAGVYEAGICSPDDPIHAPTHCGYDNVRRGLVPAPTVDSVPDEFLSRSMNEVAYNERTARNAAGVSGAIGAPTVDSALAADLVDRLYDATSIEDLNFPDRGSAVRHLLGEAADWIAAAAGVSDE